MPGTRRIPPTRHATPRVTPRAVMLFEQVMKLKRRQGWSPAIRDLSCELDFELGMKPWNPDVLRCDSDEPDRDWPLGPEDYYRSRKIRRVLEAAVHARRQAAKPPATDAAPDAPAG
jgi:hypothetical protein